MHNKVVSAKEQLTRLVDSLDEDEAADVLNLLALRAKIDEADRELERGEFTDYDENSIQQLAEDVKRRGRTHLDEERKTKAL